MTSTGYERLSPKRCRKSEENREFVQNPRLIGIDWGLGLFADFSLPRTPPTWKYHELELRIET